MKLLILGGTRFVGRALVEQGLALGHEITIFNRGHSNPELFPEIETLVGDRDGGLSVLQGGKWDAVIDTCGYVPRLVRRAAEMLSSCVEHYTFISSISVFSRFDQPGLHEHSPVGRLENKYEEEVNERTYGPFKALCEIALDSVLPGRALHVRPGLIVGPHDESDRLTYWAWRVAQGGEVLVPGKPDAPMQFIDVCDLANWTISATERRLTGPYICTGPAEKLTSNRLFETCLQVSGSDASATWVGDQFLCEQGLTEESEVPWWVPDDFVGYATFKTEKALNAGLTFRPLAATVQEIIDWHATRPSNHQWKSGLRPQLEEQLLRLWHDQYSEKANSQTVAQ